MNDSTKITAKILIFVFIVLMSAVFIPMNSVNHDDMDSADCFGVGCGMVQHFACDLSQNYFPEQNTLSNYQTFSSNIDSSEYSFKQIILSPATPPPQSSLV